MNTQRDKNNKDGKKISKCIIRIANPKSKIQKTEHKQIKE